MKIYLTLDYELYLGSKTGSVQNCLFIPTAALLEVLDKYGIKATFFVDAAYLLRMSQLKESNCRLQDEYMQVCKHIASLSEGGHSIQMHFHPQWLYSQHDGKEWEMDFEHYKMSDLEQCECCHLFEKSYNLLQSLSKKPITSFRAGGYSIMNFADYTELFGRLGIKNDSSALRGRYADSIYQKYSYLDIPLLTKYNFSTDITEKDDSGSFVEYPIATGRTKGIVSTMRIIKEKLSHHDKSLTRKWGDGKSVGSVSDKQSSYLIRNLKSAFSTSIEIASIDNMGASLENVFNYSNKHYKGEDFVIIGHPKNITLYSLQMFEVFVNNHKEDSFELL